MQVSGFQGPEIHVEEGLLDGIRRFVALADVDWERGTQGFTTWPKAEKYKDFRKMLDKQGKNIDAVVIQYAGPHIS